MRAVELLEWTKSISLESEPAVRCYISRSYYAALHSAKETFEEASASVDDKWESTHVRVVGSAKAHGNLVRPGASSAKRVAQLLPWIKKRRVLADYQFDADVASVDLQEHLEDVMEVFQACERVRREMRRAEGQPDEAVAGASVPGPLPPLPPGHLDNAEPKNTSRPSLKLVK